MGNAVKNRHIEILAQILCQARFKARFESGRSEKLALKRLKSRRSKEEKQEVDLATQTPNKNKLSGGDLTDKI